MISTRENMILCLQDIGCTGDRQQRILQMCEQNDDAEILRELKRRRCELIEEMHSIQQQIDRTDYLIRAHENSHKRK